MSETTTSFLKWVGRKYGEQARALCEVGLKAWPDATEDHHVAVLSSALLKLQGPGKPRATCTDSIPVPAVYTPP